MTNKEQMCADLDAFAERLAQHPAFAQDQLPHMKRAIVAFKAGMDDDGANATALIHSMIILLANLLMSNVGASQEVVVREDYTAMFFDYMTQFMQTEVCEECQYPHDDDTPCDQADEDTSADAPKDTMQPKWLN